MRKIWLHIGANKTGSTSLQRFLKSNADFLRSHNSKMIAPGTRGSINGLAIALRSGKIERATALAQELERKLSASNEENIILSSEMMWATPALRVAQAMPWLVNYEVKAVVYLNRQDRAIEAEYKQKAKNGKIKTDIQTWISERDMAGYRYDEIVQSWQQAFPSAHWIVRPFHRANLRNNSIIDDFLYLIGIKDIPQDLTRDEGANRSPGVDGLALLQSMALATNFNVKAVQRIYSSLPHDFSEPKGRLISNQLGSELFDTFNETNAWLARHFGSENPLFFDVDDLNGNMDMAQTTFTPDQLSMIKTLFQAIETSMSRKRK